MGRLALRGVEVGTRRLWFVFVLAAVTLGVYYWVWYYRVHSELRRYGRTQTGLDAADLGGIDPARSALAISLGSWLIVPPLVSQWRFYGRIRQAQELAGVQEHERINHALGFALFLLAWFLLPFEIVYGQLHLNRLWRRVQAEEEKAALGMRSAAAARERSEAVRRLRRERAAHRRRWLVRAAVLVNLALVGSVAIRGRPASAYYYAGRAEAASTLGKGLALGLAVFLVIATIGYAIVRSGIHARWVEVAFGKPVLIVTFVLLLVGAGGRVARHQAELASATPRLHGTAIQRERAQQDAQDWSRRLEPAGRHVRAGIDDVRRAGSLLRHGNSARVRALNRDARRNFALAEREARSIPDFPEPDLNQARDAFASQLGRMQQAADLYVVALDGNVRRGIPLRTDSRALAELDRGNGLLESAVNAVVRIARRVASDYGQRGT